MLKQCILVGLFAGIIAVSPLEAATVSVLVMEAGQPREKSEGQYSILWENSLLDVLFESGHIVSNSPRIQVAQKPADDFPAEARRDLVSAQEGGMEYFLVAIVDYAGAGVSLRLFNSKSPQMIYEYQYTIKPFRNAREEHESIKTAAGAITAHLK